METWAAIFLILVPIAFNLAFFELGRTFDYPNILRETPDTILRRFHAGGTPLLLRWQALLASALLMLPVVGLVAATIPGPGALTLLGLVFGIGAALVQGLGLIRWPFAVPELARRYVGADGPGAASTRATIEVLFATLHRLVGVGIGEHLGYLLTGLWTIVVSLSVMNGLVLAAWLGWIGLPIGAALVLGSFEFVGKNEKDGWHLAGTIVPIAYVAWSAWLIALGLGLLF